MTASLSDTSTFVFPSKPFIDLILDLWRASRRAMRDTSTPESVRLACESALERVVEMGFRVSDMIGEPYQENMLVHVLQADGVNTNRRISECVSPAIYYQGDLVRRAEVIIAGEDIDATDG